MLDVDTCEHNWTLINVQPIKSALGTEKLVALVYCTKCADFAAKDMEPVFNKVFVGEASSVIDG